MHSIAKLFILGLDYGYCTKLLSNLGIHQVIGRHCKSFSILQLRMGGFVFCITQDLGFRVY